MFEIEHYGEIGILGWIGDGTWGREWHFVNDGWHFSHPDGHPGAVGEWVEQTPHVPLVHWS